MSQTRFIHGFHAIIAKLRHQPDAILEIFIDAERHDARVRDLMRHAELHTVRVVPVDAKRLEGMAGGDMRHQGVVARVSGESRHVALDDVLDTLEEPAFLLVLDGIQDPHNLGACLRVADAVGAHAVIAPKDRAVGLTQTAIKVASGAAESVPYITVTNLARTLRELKEREIFLIGTDADATEDLYSCLLYTSPGMALDREAMDRGNSVYFPRRVIPMLPEKLSNGLCSLNPDVERLAMVCDMDINSRGEIKDYTFYPAVFLSRARLTYDQVWSWLSGIAEPQNDTHRAVQPQ